MVLGTRIGGRYSVYTVADHCYIPNILLLPSAGWLRMALTNYSFDSFMRKTYLYNTLILSLLAVSLCAMPRLTVVAVVDGMTAEDLNTLRPYGQQGGIRTLS